MKRPLKSLNYILLGLLGAVLIILIGVFVHSLVDGKSFCNLVLSRPLPLSFPLCKIDWVAISAVAVAGALVFTAQQAKAMKEIERSQKIPAVEVRMIYDGAVQCTFFEYFNFSGIPAFVSIDVGFNLPTGSCEPHHIGSGKNRHYRIGPKVHTKTAPTFFDTQKNLIVHRDGTSAHLRITVKNALLDDPNLEMTYPKDYIFKVDGLERRWNEETWGFTESIPLFS